MNTPFILSVIKSDFKKFFTILLIVFILSIFLMNFISLPALILDKQIVFAPEFSIINFLFLIVFSLLASIAISLNMYYLQETKKLAKKETVLSAFGAGFGMFISACSICQPLLITYAAIFLGVPISFSFLPLQGEEFKIISLALLVGSIYLVSKNLGKCEIKNKNKE